MGIDAMTNITEQHRHAFQTLTSRDYENFALFSCFGDNEPAAAIVAVDMRPPEQQDSEPEYAVRPLFMSLTQDMKVTAHDGREA